ncbi:tigger transposable element-derived protein 1-like [Penaeus vannamei]|uniref:tigger transposable element-derived protein 1-like n=1 Tax=Penaeus vannamei TaxID=6689 RepID=UPI00387FAC03
MRKALAVGPKRPRKRLTIAEKVTPLDMLREGRSYAAVGRSYGTNDSSARSIKKEENDTRTTAAISLNQDANRAATRPRKTTTLRWMRTSSAQKLEHQSFADSDDTPDREEEDADTGPSSSAVPAVPSAFNASKGIIEEGGYKPEQVFNMDETGLFWKRMPSRTFNMQEEAKAPGLKAQKDRLTLSPENKNKDDLPVYWMHNAKAWMTNALNLDWFKHCFIPEVKRYLRGKGLDFKVLLLVDSAGGHADDLAYDGVQIEFLPPNTIP